jgi:cytochrome c-type biogenesis protein CcmH/NrfF
MASLRERRAKYEAAVRELRGEAQRLLAEGLSEEAVARRMVRRRNELKYEARLADNRAVVWAMELRNLRKYGDPIGPGPDW